MTVFIFQIIPFMDFFSQIGVTIAEEIFSRYTINCNLHCHDFYYSPFSV